MSTQLKLGWEMRMSAFDGKLDSLLNEMKDLKKSMDFVNTKFEEFKNEIQRVVKRQSELEKENVSLKELVSLQGKELGFLKGRMELIDRSNLEATLELASVYQREGENTLVVVRDIAKAVDLKLDANDIVKVFRRGRAKSGKVGSVVVTCKSMEIRDKFITAVKSKKLLNENIGIRGNRDPIYAREELTPFGKELFFKALDFKKANNWKFLWVKGGKIFLREKEGARYHIISAIADLGHLI